MRSSGFAMAIALTFSAIGGYATAGLAQTSTSARDGQKDFDWEIGTWTTKVKVRRNPLSETAADWVEYEGTSVVKPLLGARANFVELTVAGANGKIEGGSLRLYNPKSRQWSLNYASANGGVLTAPVFGQFNANGRGLFYGQDTLDGRMIIVRFIIALNMLFKLRFIRPARLTSAS